LQSSTATLLAALIAAGTSLTVLFINVAGARRAEMRVAYRQAIQPMLPEIAEGVHEILASASILRKRAMESQETSTWIERGQVGVSKLAKVRPQLRYVLYGLDEPLRTLSRIPGWIATYKALPNTNADDLLVKASDLGKYIDRTIRQAYSKGLPPGLIIRWRANRKAQRIRKLWDERFDLIPRID
jgi:hypothetical protein